jgi:hypothetical protein
LGRALAGEIIVDFGEFFILLKFSMPKLWWMTCKQNVAFKFHKDGCMVIINLSCSCLWLIFSFSSVLIEFNIYHLQLSFLISCSPRDSISMFIWWRETSILL